MFTWWSGLLCIQAYYTNNILQMNLALRDLNRKTFKWLDCVYSVDEMREKIPMALFFLHSSSVLSTCCCSFSSKNIKLAHHLCGFFRSPSLPLSYYFSHEELSLRRSTLSHIKSLWYFTLSGCCVEYCHVVAWLRLLCEYSSWLLTHWCMQFFCTTFCIL